jgi:hypothetical protein
MLYGHMMWLWRANNVSTKRHSRVFSVVLNSRFQSQVMVHRVLLLLVLLSSSQVLSQLSCAGSYGTLDTTNSILPSGSATAALNNLVKGTVVNLATNVPVVGAGE